MPAACMTKLHRQHVSDPCLALVIQQILTLSEAAVIELRNMYRLALGHLHSIALNLKLDGLTGIWLCPAPGHH